MSFRLSNASKRRLEGIDHGLEKVVLKAIEISEMDFGVSCGLRTREQQRALVDRGLSQTMNSKHLTGHAVDVYAWFNGKISWGADDFFPIADAFQEASNIVNVNIRWGGAWEMVTAGDERTDSLTYFYSDAEDAQSSYVNLRREQGRRPFIDMPHFELI